MNKKLSNIYTLIVIGTIFLLPIIIENTNFTKDIVFVYMPTIIFLMSMFCGYSYGKTIFFPIIVSVSYFITIFIYYDLSYISYVLVYFLLSFVGNNLGYKFNKKD